MTNQEIVDHAQSMLGPDYRCGGDQFERLIVRIHSKDPTLATYRTLGLQNKASRFVFTAITGLPLPLTERGTQDVLTSWLGDAWEDYQARKINEREEKEASVRAKEHARLTAIHARVRAGEPVDGPELADILTVLYKMPPRTIGTLRSGKVSDVTATQYNWRSKSAPGFGKYTPCHWYLAAQQYDDLTPTGWSAPYAMNQAGIKNEPGGLYIPSSSSSR